MPRASRPIRACSLSRILSTTFSPFTEGSDAIRTSIGWPPTVEPHTPILRQALLGDVEARHDLEAGGDAGHHAAGDRGGVVEHAVDPVADAHVLAVRLEVDVRSAFLDPFCDHAVDQLDHRRVARRLADLGDLAHVRRLFGLLLDCLGDRGVELRGVDERGIDVLGGGNRGPDVEPGHDRDVVDGADVGRIGHRDHQRLVADERNRDRAVALRRLRRNQVDRAEIDVEHVQVEVVETEALRGRPGELVGRDHALCEQDMLGRMPTVAGLGNCDLDPLSGSESELDDVIGYEPPGTAAAVGGVSPGLPDAERSSVGSLGLVTGTG